MSDCTNTHIPGDGQTDDTLAINAALKANANCKITYFPHGVYVVTDTIKVPPGSRIVGEVWSVITASGSNFDSSDNPRALLRVGEPGDVGIAEVSDMLMTVADVLPGTILIEVNMAGTIPGDVSFHNTHTRVGGAADSRVESACQSESQPCKAAFMHAHLTKTSSSYWENSWLWTADHDLDGTNPTTIAVGRGMLVSAQSGTWLVGTGSEHNVLYAYQFADAQNVYASMQQVETPYWQPAPRAPAPWTPDAEWQDPAFACDQSQGDECYMSWHLRIMGSQTRTIALYGQAFWVFFFKGSLECLGPDGTCQTNSVNLQGLGNNGTATGRDVAIYNLNTRGVYDLVRLETSSGRVASTQAENPGSWGGLVAAYLGYQ
jgi:glucan 1,3-beta-glucosidase